MQRNRGKQWNGENEGSLQENTDTKGTFHAKMGTIKDRNGINLTEAEDIKKRWRQYRENYTKEIFTTQITMMVWSLT